MSDRLKTLHAPAVHGPLEDVERIRSVVWDHGVDISRFQAHELWSAYSESRAASWLYLPESDEDLLSCLINP